MKTIGTGVMIAVMLIGTSTWAGGLGAPVADEPVAVVQAEAAPASADWSGFYAGLSYGMGEFESEGLTIDYENVITGYAGYMWDLGAFVAGVEGEIGQGSSTTETDDLDLTLARAKARVGYDAGAFLPYVVAGFSVLEQTTDNLTAEGPFAGVGLDYNVTDAIRIGGEYLVNPLTDENDFETDLTTMALRVSYAF